MYRTADGQEIFIVDGHVHFWDGSRENWRNPKYAAGWLNCFYDYHKNLSPPEEVWPLDRYAKYPEEQLLKDFPNESIGVLRNLAGAFQFSGEDIDKKIRILSGGEKTRLVMARMLLEPPNFLVLDEPTNHLDLATKEMLLEALHDFEGTMLFVSHDRAFLKGLSNRVLELGGETGTEAQPHAYPGTYEEYVARTGHEAPGIFR